MLAGSRTYDRTVFNLAWKSSGNGAQILRELIPNDLPAEFSYLDYLVGEQKFDEAGAVWKRIAANPGTFDPQQANGYIDTLIKTGLADVAYHVWSDLQAKGLVRKPPGGPNQNLITNGNFEDPLLNMGFGWRIQDASGVYAGPDTATFHSPGHSLSVQFTGNQNLNYHQTFQFIKVSPNHEYQLNAFMKTQNITSDSGPRLEVVDEDGAPAQPPQAEFPAGFYGRAVNLAATLGATLSPCLALARPAPAHGPALGGEGVAQGPADAREVADGRPQGAVAGELCRPGARASPCLAGLEARAVDRLAGGAAEDHHAGRPHQGQGSGRVRAGRWRRCNRHVKQPCRSTSNP